MSGLELASVVRQLRAELNEAMDDADGERLRFELGPIELSLTVTVSREASPGAKIRFWVIEAGADATVSREAAQDIKLVLTPRDPTPAFLTTCLPITRCERAVRVGCRSLRSQKTPNCWPSRSCATCSPPKSSSARTLPATGRRCGCGWRRTPATAGPPRPLATPSAATRGC